METGACGIVARVWLRAGKSGGVSRIASAAAVHNRLLEEHPDLLAALYGDYVFRRMELDAEFGSGVLVKKGGIFSRQSGTRSSQASGADPPRPGAAGDAATTTSQS